MLSASLAFVVLAFNALFVNALPPQQRSYEASDGKNGAVASESKICSKIGIVLLKNGGNAADALVGTVLCIGVVGMYHSG